MRVLLPTVRRVVSPLGACLALAIAVAPAGALAADREANMEKVEYHGWKNNLRLGNDAVEVIVTLDVGPRVISYRLKDGKNVFKEYPDQLGKAGEKEWMIRGGHRLWAAPEDATRTYFPDNGPVAHEPIAGGARLTPAPEAPFGLQKAMEVSLEGGSKVKVVHRITNVGTQPTELAAWSLSVMAPGGVEVLPLPPHRPHPGSAKAATSASDFLPSTALSLWPYTDLKDPRWDLGSRFILLHQRADAKGPTKLGLLDKSGWVAYANGGTLFVKRFDYEEGRPYPDGGVNYETFTNEDMLEMESLSPMVRLAPGASVVHTERWELFGDAGEVKGEPDVVKNVLPKIGVR